jgi:hypothetical protein
VVKQTAQKETGRRQSWGDALLGASRGTVTRQTGSVRGFKKQGFSPNFSKAGLVESFLFLGQEALFYPYLILFREGGRNVIMYAYLSAIRYINENSNYLQLAFSKTWL